MKWKESTKTWQNFQFTIVDNDKKTIAIFTFATGDKCYSTLWWDGFYGKLQSAFGRQYNIMEVLPVENVSQINFKAPHYYIREIMTNTEVFTGAGSGIMHLASASSNPTVVLFSVTDRNGTVLTTAAVLLSIPIYRISGRNN